MQPNTVLHMLMALCALNEGETKVSSYNYEPMRNSIKFDKPVTKEVDVSRRSYETQTSARKP